MQKHKFTQIVKGDSKKKDFLLLSLADIKRLYNALLLDETTNDEPDEQTAELLQKLLSKIDKL
jgi:hypothetical protein